MTEKTATFSFDEILRLRTLLQELRTSLQGQQDLLKLRGMSLAPGLIGELDALEKGLARLEKAVADDDTELQKLRKLAEMSALVNSSRQLDQVLNQAMDQIIGLTGAERGYILAHGVTGNDYSVLSARDPEATGPDDRTFRGSNTIAKEVLATQQPLLTDNAYNDPRFDGRLTTINRLSLRSVMCVPMTYQGKITGVVYVDNRLQAAMFDPQELSILTALANQIAVAIENAHLFARGQANLAEITALSQVRENVFGSINSGVITTDAADLIRTMNRAAHDILETTRDLTLNKPITGLLKLLKPEHLHVVREENQQQLLEAEVEVKTETTKILSLKLSPLKDADQRTQGVAVVVDDLTEQRQRDESLQLLRRYLPPAMVDNITQIAGLALGGERRELSCMYVDVRSLASFPQDLRPRQVMALLNDYHAVATDCINQTNGIIDKYMGTEIMALYNTQLNPQADHVARALQAALLMRERFKKLYAEKDPVPHCRIGIHSGVATTGNVGSANRRDFTALGDTINLAHRLLENAHTGEIILSEVSYQQMQKLNQLPQKVQFKARTPIQAKGRQQTTAIYEVIAP
jgi:class 3 adenylate cyclase